VALRCAIEKLIAAFEDAAFVSDDGVEFWTARDLQHLLGYTEYRNFINTADKAKIACVNSGQTVGDHFVDVTNMIEIGQTVRQAIKEIGGTMPENLPAAEDVKKVDRRLRKGVTSPPKKLK